MVVAPSRVAESPLLPTLIGNEHSANQGNAQLCRAWAAHADTATALPGLEIRIQAFVFDQAATRHEGQCPCNRFLIELQVAAAILRAVAAVVLGP